MDLERYRPQDTKDVLVVGAGPAGLATLHAAREAGLQAVALDKGPVCGALLRHPTYMRWFSTADKLELSGFPLVVTEKNPTRREYLKYCQAFVRYFQLQVATYQEVLAILPREGLFQVASQNMHGRKTTWRARNVVVSTGFYDAPRPLNVPGEDLPKVSHRYQEAHYYADQRVMIIGAGSSAAEVALEIWRYGAEVTVVMRGNRFQTKYWIEPDIENRIREGSITCYRNAEVVRVEPDAVVVQDEVGYEHLVPNDFVLAMTGYTPDTSILEAAGVVVDRQTAKPELSEHLESTVPGLYVAGTLCAGCESNVVFVENSRDHGPAIIAHIISQQNA
jgi:thioredoxin reductase (NADPH)